MNTVKEKVKLYLAYPAWHREMDRIKKSKKPRIFLVGTPVHGNLGDHAIAEKEKEFLIKYFPEYELFEILMPMYHTEKRKIKQLAVSEDIIAISGGGWMGNLWLENEKVIREIVAGYPKNKIVILPQTIYYTRDRKGKIEFGITKKIFEKHKDLCIFMREENSYLFMKEKLLLKGKSFVELAPDMVLYGERMIQKGVKHNRNKIINVCFRDDCEAVQDNTKYFIRKLKEKFVVNTVSTVIKAPVALSQRKNALHRSWREFREADLTITDRLHAMLFSVINGTPCIVMDNRTGKVFGVAKWLEGTGMVRKATTVKQAAGYVMECLTSGDTAFSELQLSPYFEKMAERIRKG
ncbi:hypothetical protein D7V86_08460 [bacterium D16-51]|nr:hypothetical protein D7V96_08445 [bacterium D16-59]RKI60623.1 hypothetical protein D7V86_08460 [bacterium D16-51]